MARTTASRRPFFPLLGEPLALDFVNTVIWREPDSEPVDLISQPHRWAQWLDYQWPRLEPIVAATPTDHLRSRECLYRVRELRDAARVVINAARLAQPGAPNPNAPTATTTIATTSIDGAMGDAAGNAKGTVASTAPITTMGLDRHPHPAQLDIEALLGALATATVELAASAEATPIRECQAPGCGLLFVPRHPSRRWCSSWACGNRTRAAHHYRRRRVPADPPPV